MSPGTWGRGGRGRPRLASRRRSSPGVRGQRRGGFPAPVSAGSAAAAFQPALTALAPRRSRLGDTAPWEAVEEQFRISRSRRHELTRLLAFTPSQQQQIALLRLQETQIRTLHSAIRAGELMTTLVDDILERLTEIAVERATAPAQNEPGGTVTEGALPRRNGIDALTVARLVARARRAAPEAAKEASPRWLPPLRDLLVHASKGLGRARDRVTVLNDEDADVLMAELAQLAERLEAVNEALRQRKS